MKKLSKIMSVVLMAVMVVSILPMTSFAASTGGTKEDYVWAPKVTNVADMNFTEYLNVDDVTVTKNESNNSVTLTYTPDEADVEARTQTEVRLDTAAVPGYNHYVSFDITMDKHAEFVATMDLEASDGMRPYSFYIGTESWENGDGSTTTVNRVAALQHDPDTHYVKGAALNTNDKNWWKSSAGGTTWYGHEMASKPINVKLLNKSKYMANNAGAEQIVYVYLNGKCVGQTQAGSTATANQFFNFDTLRLIHYATKAETQNITLSNIEMGYVYENEGYCATLIKDPNIREEVFLPEGDKVYVKYTLPTTPDMAWDIVAGSLKGSPAEGLAAPNNKNWVTPKWTGTFGYIADSYLDKGNTHLTSFDDATGVVTDGSGGWWASNIQFWGPANGTAEIAIIVDRVNGTYTVERAGYPYAKQTTSYADFSAWCKAPSGQKIQFRHAAPTYTDLATQGVTSVPSSSWGWNTAGFAKRIEVGEVIERDLKVTKVTGTDGVAKISATGFGNTESDKIDVIVAQRDGNGDIVNIGLAQAKVENGVWWLNNKTAVADGAASASVYVWDDMKTNLEPICKSESLDITAE